MNNSLRIEFNEVSTEFANYLINNREKLFNQFFANIGPQDIKRIDWSHNVREKTVIFVIFDIQWPYSSEQRVMEMKDESEVLSFQ
jgi:hypothetical protein